MDAKELDHALGVVRLFQPTADPAGIRQNMVGLSPTGGDNLVMKFAGQWKVGKAVTVHVTHFLPSVAILDSAEAVWDSFNARPGGDRIADHFASSLHLSN